MKNREFKIGDKVEVISQSDYMFPEVGEQGVIEGMTSGYPKIRFTNAHPMVENLQGLVTVDPISIKLIK
jgi:hypothetical protein